MERMCLAVERRVAPPRHKTVFDKCARAFWSEGRAILISVGIHMKKLNSKAVLAWIAVCAFLVLVVINFLSKDSVPKDGRAPLATDTPRTELPTSIAPIKSLEQRQGAASEVEGVPASTAEVTKLKLFEELEKARNYRAFIQEALSKPEEGGAFLASMAYKRCFVFSRIPSDDSSLSSAQYAAKNQARQTINKCDGVSEQFGDALVFEKTLQSIGKRDPQWKRANEELKAKTEEDFRRAFLEAAQIGGKPLVAYMISKSLYEISNAIAVSNSPIVADGVVWSAASNEVVCELLDNCSSPDWTLAPCLAQGICVNNVRELNQANNMLEGAQLYGQVLTRLRGLVAPLL